MLLDRLVRLLLPRQDLFFTLLEGIAAKMTAAAAVFDELAIATSHEQFAPIAARLKPIETAADHLCHQLYEELDRTFVTPIDREDLAALTSALDDVIDSMEHAAAFAALYRFDTLTEPMRRMIRITTQAVPRAGPGRRQPPQVQRPRVDPRADRGGPHARERGRRGLPQAIAALFADDTPAKELVRQKDMLFSLEDGVDQCEDAMDVIRSVVVKNG